MVVVFIIFIIFIHVPLFFCLPAAIVPSQLGKDIYFRVLGLVVFFAYLDRRARRTGAIDPHRQTKEGKERKQKGWQATPRGGGGGRRYFFLFFNDTGQY